MDLLLSDTNFSYITFGDDHVSCWTACKRILLMAEYACSTATVVLASFGLIYVILKAQWSDRKKNIFRLHQRCSLMVTVFFFLTHIQMDDKQFCASMCIPMQYCFVAFLTLVLFELLQDDHSGDQTGEASPLTACILGWVLPAIPIIFALQLNQDACWLSIGPELAFATMLPVIVVTSTTCFISQFPRNGDVPKSRSTGGHFSLLTNAWLLYFCAVMVSKYRANLPYAMCYACCCVTMSLCMRTRKRVFPKGGEKSILRLY